MLHLQSSSSSSDEVMEVEEQGKGKPAFKVPRMKFRTLNEHLRTGRMSAQGKRNMNHLMVWRGLENIMTIMY